MRIERMQFVLDSVIRVNKKYYPQTLLEEFKYVIRKNEMEHLINDDLSSYDESDNESDNKSEADLGLLQHPRWSAL